MAILGLSMSTEGGRTAIMIQRLPGRHQVVGITGCNVWQRCQGYQRFPGGTQRTEQQEEVKSDVL
jgi:hypothetical protein